MKTTIKYLFFGMTFYFCHLTLLAQNKNIDSLLTLLKTDKPDTGRVNHLNKLCKEYIIRGIYDTALYYGNPALELAKELNFKKGIANSYNSIGAVYYYKGDYSKALENWFKTLKLNEEIKDKTGTAKQLGNIGIVYLTQGDYPKAIDYFFKTLKIDEGLGDKSGIAEDMGNIAVVYQVQKNYSKALEYYFKALKMAEELGDKNGIAADLGNIGIVFSDHSDYPKALDYFFKALKMNEELGDKHGIAIRLGNIGSLYALQKKYAEAEKYLLAALAIDTTIVFLDHIRSTHEQLSGLYTQTGNYKKALEHYTKAMMAKDTLFSQENKKQLVRKEMNYEFDKKETAAKAKQDKKDAIVAEEKQRQKIITYSISFGLFLVLLLAFFIFRGYRQKQKANISLAEKNKIIEEKNKEITDSINYAKRIQQAKLPKKEEIYNALSQSFVLFKPKDIVSGDFYFFHKNKQSIFIAAADCTGHGVPGAFMSMIGSEKLEDAVSQTSDTSEILKLLNKGIKTSLHQSEINESTRDGMDIALCSVDTIRRIIKYAGANRPIYIIRKEKTEVEEIKGTKKAIGGFTENDQHFDTQEIKLQQGDTFYISTDGYADQFGGTEGKKLMTKRFKEILLQIQDKTMQEQEKYLDTFANNWRGNREQIDDILVIGIRL